MKTQNRYCFYIPKELAERLVEYCEKNNGIKKSTVVVKALEEWLNNQDVREYLKKETQKLRKENKKRYAFIEEDFEDIKPDKE